MTAEHSVKPHVLHVFPGFDVGGVQLRISSIMNRFPDRYRHTIVAMNDRFECAARLDGAVDARPLPLGLAKGRPVDTFRRIRRELRDIAPDLLITYNWGSIEWALVNRFSAGVPHIHMESGFGPEEANGQHRRRIFLRRLALARTRTLVVPSRNLMRIARDIWDLPAEKLLYIANGVDLRRFAAAPDPGLLPSAWHEAGAVVVGTVAPLRPEKNISRMLRGVAAASAERDLRLLVVGDGPERADLAALAASLGIAGQVHFTGYLDAPERAFGLMDIYAMSSDTEQMPNALIQAMAASRPVVATDVGDIADIVSPENRAFVVSAEDEAGYQKALGRLADDAAARGVLASANLARVRAEFDQDRMFAAYRDLFDAATRRASERDMAA